MRKGNHKTKKPKKEVAKVTTAAPSKKDSGVSSAIANPGGGKKR